MIKKTLPPNTINSNPALELKCDEGRSSIVDRLSGDDAMVIRRVKVSLPLSKVTYSADSTREEEKSP